MFVGEFNCQSTSSLTYTHTPCTVFHMKTTVNIDDTVMKRLKEEAARRGTTMSALIEAGLRIVLSEPSSSEANSLERRPLPTWDCGGFLVDISNRDELYDAMGDN